MTFSEQEMDYSKLAQNFANQINSNSLHNSYVKATPTNINPSLPTTRVPRTGDWEGELQNKLMWGNPTSYFQNFLEELFTTEEQWEYLESIGYSKVPSSSYVTKAKDKSDPTLQRTHTLGDAFLIEMKIKFKNLLLSKSTLKLKI